MKKNKISKLLKRIGISIGLDREILWSTYNRIWTGIKGPISVFFILKFLSPEEQGLWYAFINLGALKVFAELGFTNIITQFVSHEYANVLEKDKKIYGSFQAINRFFSLIKYSVRLYTIIIPIAIVIMLFIGIIYFKSNELNIIVAWSFFSIVSGASLLLSLFQAIYKGTDKVKIIQMNLLLGSVFMGLGNWLFLYLDLQIWALIIGNVFGFLTMLVSLYRIAPEFWIQLIRHKVNEKISWGTEILQLQWKYAISWISGYFIFNLIVPVLYKYEDPILAGKYGITFTIIAAVVGISQAWVIAKIPKFNIMVAKKKRHDLNTYFNKSFMQSIVIQISLSMLLVIIFTIVSKFNIYSERFLDFKYIVLLLVIQLPIQIVNFLAIYLRAHKEEPLVIYSVLSALMISFALLYILPHFGFEKLMYFITFSYWLILLPYAYIVFLKKRKLYIDKYYKTN